MFLKKSKTKSKIEIKNNPVVKYSNSLLGEITIPGDKSISQRALLLGLLSIGETKIINILRSDDVYSTYKAIKLLGANVIEDSDELIINGLGVGNLLSPKKTINMGNSGTGCRLLLGIIASSSVTVTITGDKSLSSRPMDRVIIPLEKMGAKIISSKGMTLPITITGAGINGIIMPIDHVSKVSSAQVKSAILLAGLSARGVTSVTEPTKSRNNTETLLKQFGAKVVTNFERDASYKASIYGEAELIGSEVVVPGDPSSAAFFAVASIVTKKSKLKLKNVYLSPLRGQIYKTLQTMGANIIIKRKKTSAINCADIIVTSSKLNNIEIEANKSSLLIDEYPILAIAAACSKGRMVMRGLSELRHKEGNRFEAIYYGLKKCGVRVDIEEDDIIIYGVNGRPKGGCVINANLDHRIAMAFSIMSLVSIEPIKVKGCSSIKSSFPNFFDLLSETGVNIL